METIDPGKVASVWQRVHPEAGHMTNTSGLSELIAQQLSAALAYSQLSRQFRGTAAQILGRLQEEKRTQAACLKGIYRLMNDTLPNIKVSPEPQRNPETALRRCYLTEQQSLMQYRKHSTDPEFGAVFSQLANRELELLLLILELLGNLNIAK